MSEPKLISPMLDNFAIGGPISTHHGVSCYPAMENDFDDKYIVKIISVPASQTQLDALLLTGAYTSLDAAMTYFKETADEIVQEVKVLEKLSQLEGFLPYRSYQCEQKLDGNGYDVYLLSPYRRTLTRQFTRNPLTHLDALNLGLDLCAALAVCRRSGYLYVDLKPNNIFVSSDKGYYIGDLGFIRLDSLQYASLPEKYHSEYTAPEIADAFSALNTTLDVYALGLILYQVYNNGSLPVAVDDGTFPAPEYADYEIAEIILKALAVNPVDRWQDPSQIGQALVSYMQRNGANDTPIVPPVPVIAEPDTTEEAANAENASEEAALTQADDPALVESSNSSIVQEDTEADNPETMDVQPSPESMKDEDYINLSFLDGDNSDVDVDLDIEYNEVTDEVSDILCQADELVSHPVPEPVVAPDPVEIPLPEPIVLEEEEVAFPVKEEIDLETGKSEETTDAAAVSGDTADANDSDTAPKKRSHWLRNTIIILLVAALLAGGYYYYENFYLQDIQNITVRGTEDKLSVSVESAVDDSLLSVVCADPHGNKVTEPVVEGKADFTGLLPNTTYSVTVQIDGFHKLLGNTTTTYSTPVQTNIVQFSAVTGSEDGSVILGFTVEGPDSEKWSVSYSAEGEEAELATFPGHTVALNGLTVGKEYTFTLIPESELYITGTDQITHTASKLIYAQNLQVVSCVDNTLTAVWDSPADLSVESWTVRCNGDNYSESIIVNEPVAVFEGLDHTASYTVEVVAAGMSVSQRVTVEENAVTINDFIVDSSVSDQLTLSWTASSEVPENGWILKVLVNGAEIYAPVICNDASAMIEGIVPNAQYTFTIEDLDETQYLGIPVSYQTTEASLFTCNYDGYEITGDDITFSMCKTPSDRNWNRYDLYDEDYRNEFVSGEKASFLMHMEKAYGDSVDEITTTFVIYDAAGIPVSVNSKTAVWNNMWYRYYGELDIPELPSSVGEYTISTYFNGALVNTQNFTITE